MIPEPPYLSRFDPLADDIIEPGEGGFEIVFLCGVLEDVFPAGEYLGDPGFIETGMSHDMRFNFGKHPLTGEDILVVWGFNALMLVLNLDSDGSPYIRVALTELVGELVPGGVYFIALVVGAADPKLTPFRCERAERAGADCDEIAELFVGGFEANSEVVEYILGATSRPDRNLFYQPWLFLGP